MATSKRNQEIRAAAMAATPGNPPTTKHTPGPWGYRKGSVGIAGQPERLNRIVITAPIKNTASAVYKIAELRGPFHSEENPDANARLIAAAPDLLQALKKEQEWREREQAGALDDEWAYETIVGQYRRAAIAAAEGSAA